MGWYRRQAGGLGSRIPLAAALATLALLHLGDVRAHAAPPSNDDFGSALSLAGNSATVDTREATREPAEPLHAGLVGATRTVWYRWRAPVDGAFRVSVCGLLSPAEPAALAVYRGRRLARLREQAAARVRVRRCSEEETSVRFETRAGATYRLAFADRTSVTRLPAAMTIRPATPPPPPRVAGATLKPRTAPRVRKLPIGRRLRAKPRTIASLGLHRLGRLEPGSRLGVSGELQLTVCLRNAGDVPHRGDCTGRIYGYDPRIRVHLALAGTPGAATPKHSTRISPARTITCTQSQPARNHHCALTIPWSTRKLKARSVSRCAPSGCRLNLVAAAAHRRAGPREKVIVGGISKRGRISSRGAARIAAMRYGPGVDHPRPLETKRRMRGRVPLVPDGRSIRMSSVYSLKIPRPRAGEVIRVSGRYLSRLASVPYNARTRVQLVVADRPRATRPGPRSRRLVDGSARLTDVNFFNCTHGRSGHRSPCSLTKPALTGFKLSAKKPVYVNLLAGHGAIGMHSDRRKGRDRLRVLRKGGLSAWRYRP